MLEYAFWTRHNSPLSILYYKALRAHPSSQRPSPSRSFEAQASAGRRSCSQPEQSAGPSRERGRSVSPRGSELREAHKWRCEVTLAVEAKHLVEGFLQDKIDSGNRCKALHMNSLVLATARPQGMLDFRTNQTLAACACCTFVVKSLRTRIACKPMKARTYKAKQHKSLLSCG